MRRFSLLSILLLGAAWSELSAQDRLEPIKYNNPGLVVDLGVGLWAWPLPMDYDRDGDLDLVVSCPDVPFRGTYFFENPGVMSKDRSPAFPVFKPPVRIADAMPNVQVSDIGGEPIVSSPGKIYIDFRTHQYSKPIALPVPTKIDPQYQRIRANQWKLVDWEGDGDHDLIVGIGVWDDYGWDDAWDEYGNWKNGPLHGYVYLVENIAMNDGPASDESEIWKSLPDDEPWPDILGPRPVYAAPRKVNAGGKPVDVYGMPSPNFADFDADGDLDLICGEFLDGFTWFENAGTRAEPNLKRGIRLSSAPLNSREVLDEAERFLGIRLDLQMITPVAVDWDQDGDIDLICGDEDGRVAWIEHLGFLSQSLDGGIRVPSFNDWPQYFRQEARDVKYGALVTPVGVDWDNDGDEDIVCGNTAGYVAFIENLDGAASPKFAPPIGAVTGLHLDTLRHKAGEKGSIQGPCEAKWGYTTISIADWDREPGQDLIVNDIEGNVRAYSLGSPIKTGENPQLYWLGDVNVLWEGAPAKPAWTWWSPRETQLTTQWRTTPCAVDWNDDGLNDLLMLDHEGYLAFYEREIRENELVLRPPRRIFKISGPCEFDSRHRPVGDQTDGLLRLNANRAGASGRRKLHFVDWDGDGRLDLLVNSLNVNWLRNVRTDDQGFVWFEDQGPLDELRLAGHTTSPTTVDWDKNGIPDLLVGAEDGRLYYKRNPRSAE